LKQLLKNIVRSGVLSDSLSEGAIRRLLIEREGVAPSSITVAGEGSYAHFEGNGAERLIIISRNIRTLENFDGEFFAESRDGRSYYLLACPLNHANAARLRTVLPWTAPSVLESRESFGTGDRIGGSAPATPGHIEAVRGMGLTPVLAQQSVRENQKTGRSFEGVLDDVTWSVFREGFRQEWGSDADHLKTAKDAEEAVRAGFTMFTFDPSEKIDNAADTVSDAELVSKLAAFFPNASAMEDFIVRYEGKHGPARREVVRAGVKYLRAIRFAAAIYHHIEELRGSAGFNFEMSIDETSTETTVLDHRIIVSELLREKVNLFSLAPRFAGEFEKGIDYKGSLDGFQRSLTAHYRLSRELGEYRLSLHSGSDKFSVYPMFGEITDGFYHVKTAGTSYLEAVKVTASEDFRLFMKILDLSRETFAGNAASYHISANPANVPESDMLSREEALQLITADPDMRQALHIAFGVVLQNLGDELRASLVLNRNVYHRFLAEHIGRHVALLTGR
jgi:tagaturonate epimerase